VNVTSLGYRTDLMVRAREGSLAEDQGDCIVIRSPANPDFHWGNFLLVPALDPGGLPGWADRFAAEFPAAGHVAIGVDVGSPADADLVGLAEVAAAGLTADRSAVLTASALRPPPRPNGDATYRPLSGDADWEQSRGITLGAFGSDGDSDFICARSAAMRAMTEAGDATWYGAFLGDDLCAQLGIVVDAGTGLARYQSVETRPDARRRGLAGTLTWHAGHAALAAGRAATVVIVADPGETAIGIYRSVGFTDAQVQLGLARQPPAEPD
jgi:ribosomal protein S18 acetylase RimI-like enzyme